MAHVHGRAARILLTLLLALAVTGSPPLPATAGETATMVVTPSTDLPKVAEVSVDVDALQPHQDYLIFQCPVDPPVPCAQEVAVGFTTDGNGDAFDIPVTVYRTFERDLGEPVVIDCLAQPCRLRTYNVDGLVNAFTPISFAKIRTSTTFSVTRNVRKLVVSGKVTPTHEPVDEEVSVLLDRRSRGTWRRIATKSAELYAVDEATRFGTSFGRRTGTCRITVKYAGTDRYARSRSVRKLSC